MKITLVDAAGHKVEIRVLTKTFRNRFGQVCRVNHSTWVATKTAGSHCIGGGDDKEAAMVRLAESETRKWESKGYALAA